MNIQTTWMLITGVIVAVHFINAAAKRHLIAPYAHSACLSIRRRSASLKT